MQFSELIEEFLLAKEIEEGASPRTIRAYRYDLLMAQKIMGDLEIERIKTVHIRSFLKKLHDKGYSKKGLARKIACLKSFFRFCLENNYLKQNPMLVIKSPKIRLEEALPKYLTEDEIKEIFRKLPTIKKHSVAWRERLYLVIRLLYASMARVSEICGLQIGDIDTTRNLIKVRGKGNKERYIPIDPLTTQLLKEHIENRFLEIGKREYTAPLFVNRRGEALKIRTIQRDLAEFKTLLGWPEEKKFTPHIFRHTGATHLRSHGMDISELQDLLGHASPSTTRIYAKNDIGHLQQAYSTYHPLLTLKLEKEEERKD